MLRITPLASAIFLLLFSGQLFAEEETFDTYFMMGGLKGEKSSNFSFDGEKPLPGTYDLDLYLNNQWRGKYELNVKDEPDETCLSWELVHRLGIKPEGINADKDAQCVPLKAALQGGTSTFDMSRFRLDLNVPQAFVNELEYGVMVPTY